MNFNVGHGSIEVFQSIPDEFQSSALHQAPGQLIRTDSLKLFAHIFPGTGYMAYLADYIVDADGIMGAEDDDEIFEFRCSMKNQLTGKMEVIINPGLPPWHFNVTYATHVNTEAQFQKGRHYRVFDIHVKRTFFERFRVNHRIFGDFIDKVDAGQPIEISPHPLPCPLRMRQAIWNIINDPFTDQFAQVARDAYVRLILVLALRHIISPEKPTKFILLPHQKDALHHIKKLIEDNLDNPFTNEELCTKMIISEETLLEGFRQLFGTTPYDYYMDRKFIEAEMKLIETSEKISAIARGVGYRTSDAFDKEFKKRHGYTPTQYRQEYQ